MSVAACVCALMLCYLTGIKVKLDFGDLEVNESRFIKNTFSNLNLIFLYDINNKFFVHVSLLCG